LGEITSAVEESQRGIDQQWSVCDKIMKEAAEAVIGCKDPCKGMIGLTMNVLK
jgi:hypothetical protein